MSRRVWLIVCAVLLLPMPWFVWKAAEPHISKPFTTADWQASSPSTPRGRIARQRMASDLLETRQLMRKSREDILAMLGEPDSVGERTGASLYRLDDFYLRIRFDKNDLVESAFMSSD